MLRRNTTSNPLDVPRDERGILVRNGDSYHYGHIKAVHLQTALGPSAPAHAVILDPGDVLMKTKLGNFYLRKSTGQYTWLGDFSRPSRILPHIDEPTSAYRVDSAPSITVKAENVKEAAHKVDAAITRHMIKRGISYSHPKMPPPDFVIEPEYFEPVVETPSTGPDGSAVHVGDKFHIGHGTTVWEVIETKPMSFVIINPVSGAKKTMHDLQSQWYSLVRHENLEEDLKNKKIAQEFYPEDFEIGDVLVIGKTGTTRWVVTEISGDEVTCMSSGRGKSSKIKRLSPAHSQWPKLRKYENND